MKGIISLGREEVCKPLFVWKQEVFTFVGFHEAPPIVNCQLLQSGQRRNDLVKSLNLQVQCAKLRFAPHSSFYYSIPFAFDFLAPSHQLGREASSSPRLATPRRDATRRGQLVAGAGAGAQWSRRPATSPTRSPTRTARPWRRGTPTRTPTWRRSAASPTTSPRRSARPRTSRSSPTRASPSRAAAAAAATCGAPLRALRAEPFLRGVFARAPPAGRRRRGWQREAGAPGAPRRRRRGGGGRVRGAAAGARLPLQRPRRRPAQGGVPLRRRGLRPRRVPPRRRVHGAGPLRRLHLPGRRAHQPLPGPPLRSCLSFSPSIRDAHVMPVHLFPVLAWMRIAHRSGGLKMHFFSCARGALL